MVALNEAAGIGFFPNRKSGTRRAPGLDDLTIRSCFGTNPFKEIEDQSLNWVWHNWHGTIQWIDTAISDFRALMGVRL
jgi:hypothetical protein